MAAIKLQLLGIFQLAIADQPVTKFRSDKARAVLAYLAAEAATEAGRLHSRAHLASLFWGELPEKSAKTNLRNVLSNLRQLVPDALDISRQSVRWVGGKNIRVDLHGFRQAISNHPDKAIPLYQGEFLQGLSLPDAVVFEEWRVVWQEQLHQQMMDGLERLIATANEQDDTLKMIDYATRQLALVPWHETGHRWLMVAYMMQGQRTAALEQFERCQQILEAELGVSPSPETFALRAKIEAQAPTPHNLPQPAAILVGRDQSLSQLVQTIPHQRLVTLHGVRGVGKSLLALTAVHQHLNTVATQHFPQGIWLVPLAGVEADGNVHEQLVALLATTLNIDLGETTDTLTKLVAGLQGQRLLLLLDNLEHVVAEAEILLQTLLQKTKTHLLLTSRVQANLPREQVIRLAGLSLPAAVSLFRERAQEIYGRFSATDAELEPICRQLEQLPLAIELAASWVEHWTPAELLTAVDTNLAAAEGVQIDARQRSLRAVFDHSWTWLTEHEQRVMVQLAVFRGQIGRAEALAITDASLNDLSALRGKSLVRLEGAGRYSMHEAVREFSAEKGDALDILQTARNQHANHFLRVVVIKRDENARREIENIRAAWRLAAQTVDGDLIVFSAQAYRDILGATSTVADIQNELDWALEQLLPQPRQTKLDDTIAILYFLRTVGTTPAEAIGSLKKGLAFAHWLALKSQLHSDLAAFSVELNRLEEATYHFEQQVLLAEQSGDERVVALALYTSAGHRLNTYQGDYHIALEQLEKALAIYIRESRHHLDLYDVRLRLAWATVRCGKLDLGINMLQELLAEPAASTRSLGGSADYGYVLSLVGRHQEAIESVEQGLEAMRQLEDEAGLGLYYSYLCLVERRGGNLDKASHFGQLAVTRLEAFNQLQQLGRAAMWLGHALLAADEWVAAVGMYHKALTIWEPSNHPHQFETRAGLAHVAAKMGDWQLAQREAEAVLAFVSLSALSKVVEPPQMLMNLRAALLGLGRMQEANGLQQMANEWMVQIADLNEDEGVREAFLAYTGGVVAAGAEGV